MTNPISQAAVDAACDAYHRPKRMITNTAVGSHYDRMTAALEAAEPHIRKQIARDIRAEMVGSNWNKTFLNGLEYGAYIAEKGLEQ